MNNIECTKKKISVLQVNKLYYPVTGGIERTVQQISEGLSSFIEVKVLTCSKKNRKTRKETINGVEVTKAGSWGIISSLPISLKFLWLFRYQVNDIDIVHIHMPFPLADLACLFSKYKGKVVVWYHSDIIRQKRMMKYYKPLMKWLLNRADAIIVATEGNIDGSDYLPEYRDKCVIIPFGVNKHIEAEANKYLNKKSTKVNRKRKKVKFLFVGRLVYYKGCNELIKAFSEIDNAVLTVVGDGPLREDIDIEILEKKLEKKIRLLGDVSENRLISEYKECDVLVLPSIFKSEAFGLVQIEAMCFGKPVINTKLASGEQYVSTHNKTGITVEPGNIEELRKALKWMVDNEENRIKMGEEARKKVEKEYKEEIMLNRILILYNKLIEEGSFE